MKIVEKVKYVMRTLQADLNVDSFCKLWINCNGNEHADDLSYIYFEAESKSKGYY